MLFAFLLARFCNPPMTDQLVRLLKKITQRQPPAKRCKEDGNWEDRKF